ncbi:MAG: tyrosine-type recombinase/integrase [Pseudonocardia sp.]
MTADLVATDVVRAGRLPARAVALDDVADRYVDTQRPRTTRRAYAQDWAAWEDYTAWAGIPVLSGGRGALVGFVLWLESGAPGRGVGGGPAESTTRGDGMRNSRDDGAGTTGAGAAPATIRRRVAGVLHGLRRHHVRIDPEASRAAAAALEGYRRRLAEAGETRGRGQASAVDLGAVLAMSRACPDDLAGVRDRAMLLVGFFAATRASDQANLLVGDVVAERTGLVVTVRHGKTTGTSALPARRHPQLCPRRAWLAWTASAGIETGAAFRPVTRHGRIGDGPLSPDAVTGIVARAGRRAGLAYAVTCHSLRAGFATESYRAGATLLDIARQGRWAPGSQELLRYIREVDRWRHNAADALDIDPVPSA